LLHLGTRWCGRYHRYCGCWCYRYYRNGLHWNRYHVGLAGDYRGPFVPVCFVITGGYPCSPTNSCPSHCTDRSADSGSYKSTGYCTARAAYGFVRALVGITCFYDNFFAHLYRSLLHTYWYA